MSDRTITYLTDVVLLTVVVQRDQGPAIIDAARNVGATTGATAYFAKGIGVRERLGLLGLAVEVEKEVISLLVASDQQEVVMDHIYQEGKLDTAGMGYIYVTPLEKLAFYVPESMKEELEKPAASVR